MRKPHRTLTAVLTAVLTAGAIALTAAAPAAAHDELVSSSPEPGSTMTETPTQVTLVFSGELMVDLQSVVIEVTDPDGVNFATDPPILNDTEVVQPLTPNAHVGPYTVRWRVVSGDGHPISGEYTYTVESPPAAASTPVPTASAAEQTVQPSPTATGNPAHGEPSGGGALLPILAVASGVIILAAAVVVVLMVARERRRRDRAGAETARATESTPAGKGSSDA